MDGAKIIPFPQGRIKGKAGRKASRRTRQIKNVDGFKYFNNNQIRLLRRTVRDRAELDKKKGNITGIKEWMVIDLLTSSGVRVSEAANIRCGDLKIGYGQSKVFVREGKWGRSRTVQIPDSLRKHLRTFLKWKQEREEPTDRDDHLFIGQRGPWTPQGVSQIIKKYLRLLQLYEPGKSAHSLRHSYAVEFYSQQRDLRALQKQLGHSSIQTTQIYADVTDEDIQDQIKGLWGGPNR